MRRSAFLLAFFAFILTLVSCLPQTPGTVGGGMSYATLLTSQPTDTGVLLRVSLPWRSEPIDYATSSRCAVTRRMLCATACHARLAEMLGADSCIAALCDTQWVASPSIRRRLSSGQWRDGGNSAGIGAEYVLSQGFDAFLHSSMEGTEPLPLPDSACLDVEAADWLETSPLARAEWMKLYGALWHRSAAADSLFALVERAYLAERAANASGQRVKLLCEMPYGGQWYVPGGRSFMAQVYADAGADYPWADDVHTGGIPLSVEAVLNRAHDADVWLIKTATAPASYEALAKMLPAATGVKAFRKRRVYVCPTLERPFFEETPFRPDLLLREVRAILQGRDDSLRYFQPLR